MELEGEDDEEEEEEDPKTLPWPLNLEEEEEEGKGLLTFFMKPFTLPFTSSISTKKLEDVKREAFYEF